MATGRSMALAMEAETTGNKTVVTKEEVEVPVEVSTIKDQIITKIEEEAEEVLITEEEVVVISRTITATIDVIKKEKLKNCIFYFTVRLTLNELATFKYKDCVLFSQQCSREDCS